MSLLPLWVKALVAAGVALLAWALVVAYNESLREDGRQEVRAEWLAAAQRAQAEELKKGIERAAAQRKADEKHAQDLAAARAGAADAAAAADRLRQQLAAYVAAGRAASPHPGAAAGGAPAADALGVLAELLGRIDARAGILAEVADAARLAGEHCVRSYEALNPQLSPPAGGGPASPVPP
jgi:hypothetical protein